MVLIGAAGGNFIILDLFFEDFLTVFVRSGGAISTVPPPPLNTLLYIIFKKTKIRIPAKTLIARECKAHAFMFINGTFPLRTCGYGLDNVLTVAPKFAN